MCCHSSVKGGLNIFYRYSSQYSFDLSGIGVDAGVFAECAGYKNLSFTGELHFSDKGITPNTPVNLFSNSYIYPYYIDISNRYQYLTLQTLAKYSFSKKEIGFYCIAGLRADLMVHNYYTSEYLYFYKPPNLHFELGGTFGLGYTFPIGLFAEYQFNPNFTKMFQYSSNGYLEKFNSVTSVFYLGYIIK